MTQAANFSIEMRRPGPDGLSRVVSLSLLVHVSLAGIFFVLPHAWFADEKPEQVHFSIDLGGGPGERTSGMTSAANRPVQEVAPAPKRPTPALPAAPAKPNTVAAAIKTPPKTSQTEPTTSPTAAPRPPTTGAKITAGTSPAETGVTASQTNGLTLGGDAPGSQAFDNNFCCPDWAAELKRRIWSNWNQDMPETGRTEVSFEIRRDGSFTPPEIVKSSGNRLLDINSRAVFDPQRLKLQALPDKYTGETLKVRLVFEYKR